jgi:uncharacterized damage-inducible protein DinB
MKGRFVMNFKLCMCAVALGLSSLISAPAFAAAASPSQVYDKLLKGQLEDVVAVAEAMPADKYNFAPTNGKFDGVRTFGGQITHIAMAQYYFFSGFGAKPPIDPESLSNLKSKDEVIKALKDSYAYAEKAVATMTPENAWEEIKPVDGTNTRATITAFSLAHTNDHYGQMIEYLRMNGIVPPGSK